MNNFYSGITYLGNLETLLLNELPDWPLLFAKCDKTAIECRNKAKNVTLAVLISFVTVKKRWKTMKNKYVFYGDNFSGTLIATGPWVKMVELARSEYQNTITNLCMLSYHIGYAYKMLEAWIILIWSFTSHKINFVFVLHMQWTSCFRLYSA